MGFGLLRIAGLAALIAAVAALLALASPARAPAPPRPPHTKPGIQPQKPPTAADPERIGEVINNLTTGNSGSHLYDAMARGISLLEKRPLVQRRIMVVLGEAQDTGSENRLGEVLRSAQLANVTIYAIGLSTAMADLRAQQ